MAPAPSVAGQAATPRALEPTVSARPLGCLLVLAGVMAGGMAAAVAGVAVPCPLLPLVGSRSTARNGRDVEQP
ncbi:hypothetical protein O3Q52_45785 [Streptomyces sp. ActVer]|uniref:hypothetical protein n=1 Tax=Streptomyces sp. ActVer TaxID=3014558 RepID=UPI0022B3CB31|nr:hypothetical protein [Streptomyces sp. ActVer]MCZ4515307.1 hypothetical protein [Streptomyces sp. ActVer]